MGKNDIILLSGFEIDDNNRGSAALGYGAIEFLKQKGMYDGSQTLCMLHSVRKRFWKGFDRNREIKTSGQDYNINVIHYLPIELKLYLKYHVSLYFTPFGKLVRNLALVAATNGGDGFSDIYGYSVFVNRLKESWIAIAMGARLVIMPQTLGPFTDKEMRNIANNILKYADWIYVRDNKFENELNEMGLKYKRERDLSAFMSPEPWNIRIEPDSIGLNVSGLAYSNNFRTLSGKFDNYPILIERIIENFQKKGKTIYLIPHSYNYTFPEYANDDLVACKEVYQSIKEKRGIRIIEEDLTAPQIKYVISKMSFFVGTRMHANFAAIYTGVPVFGLAYSYKFVGAFEANGLSADQVALVTNLKLDDIGIILDRILDFYESSRK